MSQLIKKIRTEQGELQIDYNSLANLPTISNPNLLINSDFRNPINQRGQTSYVGSTSSVYTIDRWCFGTSNSGRTMEIVDGGILVTNTDATYAASFKQPFEKSLPVGDYTLTAKVTAITGRVFMQCEGSHVSTKQELAVGVNTLTLASATIDSFSFLFYEGASVTLEWAKLEVGTISTLLSSIHYAEELAMCRRYYQTVSNYRFMLGIVSTDDASGPIPLVPTMRTTPNVSVIESDYIDVTSKTHVVPADIGQDNAYTNDKVVVMQVRRNSASTFTAGQCLNCTVTAHFDAEIY